MEDFSVIRLSRLQCLVDVLIAAENTVDKFDNLPMDDRTRYTPLSINPLREAVKKAREEIHGNTNNR